MEACEGGYKKKSLTKEMADCLEIKKEIIHYGILENHNTFDDCAKIKNLIEKIKDFSKGIHQKKEGSKSAKKDDASLQSEEIESSEFRDNITDLRAKKTSLHNMMMEPA